MREYKKIQRRNYYTVLKKVTCDICGKETQCEKNWAAGPYNFDLVKVRRKHGTSDPDGGGTTTIVGFDLCPRCFTKKLVPMLRELGAEPTKTIIES